jgi:membrane-associated phospholipid phosphatase
VSKSVARPRWWFVGLLIAVVLIAGAFLLDATVHTWVIAHPMPRLRGWMLLVSRFGDWPSHIVVGAIGTAVAYLFRDRAWLRIFIAMIVACALAGIVTRVTKIAVGRARPSVTAEVRWSGPSLSSKWHSFPSGHTGATFAFFAVPCFARRRLAYAFVPIPLLIATSRILLDAHHLSDVMAAAALGILCAGIVWRSISEKYPIAAAR